MNEYECAYCACALALTVKGNWPAVRQFGTEVNCPRVSGVFMEAFAHV